MPEVSQGLCHDFADPCTLGLRPPWLGVLQLGSTPLIMGLNLPPAGHAARPRRGYFLYASSSERERTCAARHPPRRHLRGRPEPLPLCSRDLRLFLPQLRRSETRAARLCGTRMDALRGTFLHRFSRCTGRCDVERLLEPKAARDQAAGRLCVQSAIALSEPCLQALRGKEPRLRLVLARRRGSTFGSLLTSSDWPTDNATMWLLSSARIRISPRWQTRFG